MTVDYEAEFSGEEAYEAEYVAAAVKPETVGHGVPGWEAQTMRPEPGCVFSSFEMEGMPEPTERTVIDSNGEHHVERAGIADVQVPQGVFPAGTLPVTANGRYDVSGYAEADVSVAWASPSDQVRLVTQRVTLPEDFSGQATAFLPAVTALAGIDMDHQDVVVTTLAMVDEPQIPTPNEVRELVIGYTAGLRYRRTYWNGSRWTTAITTNTYFNVVAKAGSVYELVGFSL